MISSEQVSTPQVLSREQKAEECDARDDASSTEAGYKKYFLIFQTRPAFFRLYPILSSCRFLIIINKWLSYFIHS